MRARRWVATSTTGTAGLKLVEYDVSEPGDQEVTIEVRAAGVNPTDHKALEAGAPPRPGAIEWGLIGNEVAGVVVAVGPHTELATGPVEVGDEVLAFRVSGGFATALTVPARDVFAKPSALSFPEAANLLLVAATASDMIRVTQPEPGETVVVHAASGAVGVSLLQQLALLTENGKRVRAIGTAGEGNFDVVRRFGAEPVAYGPGLVDRLRALAPEGFSAAYDCVGTDEAVDASLALVDPRRFVTIANASRAQADGFVHIGGKKPESIAYRDSVRTALVQLAADGRLEVPVARTFPFAEAPKALELSRTGHPGGKLALVP
jgi:NADPH:quinone reductase-like Zn-dependent oxidoreductase